MREFSFADRVMRRTRIYRGRVGRLITQKTLTHRCAFMHLPKCGGTSLSEGLYALVPLHQKIGIIDTPSVRRAMSLLHDDVDDVRLYHDEGEKAQPISAFREQLLLMHMAQDCRLIHGHFLFSEKAFRHFASVYKFVTIMREPTARTISNFRMAVRAGTFSGSFDAFLESSKGRRMALHNLRYFSGRPTVAEGETAAAMPAAERNMARFSVIGFIEDQPTFLKAFAAVFGCTPKIGHRNRAGSERLALTAVQRSRLEQLCAPDIELYEMARRTMAAAY